MFDKPTVIVLALEVFVIWMGYPRTFESFGTFRNHVYDLHDKNEQLLLQPTTVNQGSRYNLLIYVHLGYIYNYNDKCFKYVSKFDGTQLFD